MRRLTHFWESTSYPVMMGQSCLPSQSYYSSCSKNTQKRSVSARPGRRHTRTDLRRHTINATIIKEQSPLIPVTTFIRLLGLLMYLTKSRPDIIMTIVSFHCSRLLSPPVLHRMIARQGYIHRDQRGYTAILRSRW